MTFVVFVLVWLLGGQPNSSLPACHTGTNHQRWALKNRPLDATAPTAKPLTGDELLHLAVPTGQPHASSTSVDPFERGVWTIAQAYVWLVKQSADDCDLHLEVSAGPTAGPRFIVEIPQSDPQHQTEAIQILGLTTLGKGPHRFPVPVPVRIIGWGFFDLAHQCQRDPHKGCAHGSAAVSTLAELHPARIVAP